jgi:broad specificity phosphatase PhoE
MSVLLLVKHSIPEIDPSIPARDWRLSSEGKRRCVWLARELAKFKPEFLCSSIERKARETAEAVGTHLGLASQCCDGLHENDRTDFPYIDDPAELEERFRAFFENPWRRLIGRETANDALARFNRALSDIVATRPSETICVVAHGTVISLFIARYNAVPAFEVWDSLSPLPAYIAVRLPGYECAGPAKAFAA